VKLEAREARRMDEVAIELEALVHLQWEESADYRKNSGIVYQPNFSRILQLNDMGLYRVICLWAGTEMVGYLFMFLMESLHTSRLIATHDIFFVRKDWRLSRGAFLLLSAADKLLRELGVTEVYAGHKGGQVMEKLMRKFDYAVVGQQYYKAIPSLDSEEVQHG
jgi:hypothetical protein